MIIDFSTAANLLFDAGSAAHNSNSAIPYPAGASAGAGSVGNSSFGSTLFNHVAVILKEAVKSDITQQQQQEQPNQK